MGIRLEEREGKGRAYCCMFVYKKSKVPSSFQQNPRIEQQAVSQNDIETISKIPDCIVVEAPYIVIAEQTIDFVIASFCFVLF